MGRRIGAVSTIPHQAMAPSNPKTLSVVIPSRNNADLLRKHFPHNYSILQVEAKELALDLEIVFVLEETGDRSLDIMLEVTSGELIHRCVGSDSGYGGKCNLGVSLARGSSVLILTTDVELQKGFLEPLIRVLEKPEVFSVSPQILRPLENHENESMTLGKFRRHQIEVTRRVKRPVFGEKKVWPILWPCGAIFLTTREKFLTLEGFSSEYLPGYSEDVDLGLRAWIHSWECHYSHESKALHWHNSTFKAEGRAHVEFLLVRNHILLNLKFLPWHEKPIFLLKRTLKTLKRSRKQELPAIWAALTIWWRLRSELGPYTLSRSSLTKILSMSH